MQFPIFLVTRDRVSFLAQMVEWFEMAGQEEIYFVDNDSTYEPLLDYFDTTPHTVLALGENIGWLSPWRSGYVEQIARGRYYMVGDSDMVPTEDCPTDALDFFHESLAQHQEPLKIGFSLKIDDIPEKYPHKEVVDTLAPVHQNESNRVAEHFLKVPMDSVPALYRPNAPHNKKSWMSVPHQVRHMSWYEDTRNPSDELAYYQAHANREITNWGWPDLSDRVMSEYRRRGGR